MSRRVEALFTAQLDRLDAETVPRHQHEALLGLSVEAEREACAQLVEHSYGEPAALARVIRGRNP